MASKNIEFRVGVIILLGIVILAVSLYWLEGYRLKMNSRMIDVVFPDVGTLAIGDKVTVSGVRKGKVNDLRLTPDGVEVELQLSNDVVLKRDATITIKNMGLMGERFIAIAPGRDSVTLDASKPVIGAYDTGLPEVMGLMGEMIQELRELVGTFKRTVGTEGTMGKFNTILTNLESVSVSMAGYLDRNEAKLDESAQNLLVASRRLSELMTTNAGRIDSTMTRFDRASRQVESMVNVLDTVALAARDFADQLDQPDGSLQLLVSDRRLYDDLRQTADNIDDLVSDIRANPRKYINFTLELF